MDHEQINFITFTAPSEIKNEPRSRRTFLKQLLVFTLPWMCYFEFGLCIGAPTVFIPQIRKEANSTSAVSDEMASWLSAALGYGSIPWVLILPAVAGIFGRKISLIFLSVNAFAAFVVFYTSKTVIQLLVSEVMESIIGAALSNITIMIITEYTSPKNRGFFLTFKSASMFWGIWTSNAIGTFFHWKYIGLVKLACSIYPLLVVFYIPESPYWLASKGKFEKCIESHRWLKGREMKSEMELQSLINSQKEYLSTFPEPFSLSRIGYFIWQKDFYKPTLLCMLLSCLYHLCGKLGSTFYSIDIIKKITDSESTAYVGMLILDGVTVFAMYIGSFLSKCLPRRTLLLSSSSVGVMFLYIMSIYIYLIKLSYITENHIVSILLLASYSISICCGPMIMATCVYAELLPIRHRNIFVCVSAVFDKFMMGSVLKILPNIIQKFGLEAAFVILGFLSSIFLLLLYKYLPETKDKTIQEIGDSVVGIELNPKKGVNRSISTQ